MTAVCLPDDLFKRKQRTDNSGNLFIGQGSDCGNRFMGIGSGILNNQLYRRGGDGLGMSRGKFLEGELDTP